MTTSPVLSLTTDLVATPSENPGGDEQAVAALVGRICEDLDLPPPRRVGPSDRPSLIIEVTFGPGGRHLGLSGHLDTKPIGEGAWETDPLVATVVGDQLRGRGVVDMKGAIAAMLVATAEASSRHDRGKVSLVLCADEEYGSRHGAQLFTAEDLSDVEAVVIGEPGGIHADWDRLHLGSRGICNFDLEVTTTQAHSGLKDSLGLVSATEVAARLLVAMADGFAPRHPDGPAPTLNAGAVVSGGISYGVVPGRATVASECRLVTGMGRAAFTRDLEEFVTGHTPAGADVDLTIVDWIPATEVDASHPVVNSARRAVTSVTGTPPTDDLFPATTDATWFAALGIPTLPAVGPGLLRHAHAPDETVSLTALDQAVHVYSALIADYAAGEGR